MTPRRPAPADLLLAGCLLFSLAMCLGPLANPDLPWHLAVGRRIWAEGAVPRTDYLSWTMAGRPWADFEWLTQLLFYGLDAAGGMTALWAFKALQFGALALLFAALLRLWGLSKTWVGLAVFSLIATLRIFIQIRPENASLLLFTLQLLVLEARRLGRLRLSDGALLGAHVAAYALWANLHAGFPMGLALCACYGLGELWSGARMGRTSPLLWAAAGAAGTCLNPYGPRLYAVLWEHWQDLSSLRSLINEWSAPRLGGLHGYWLLLLFSLAGFIASAARRAPLPVEHVLAALLFGLWASRSLRTTAYLILLVFPLGLLAWSRLPSPDWWRRARPWLLGAFFALAAWNTAGAMRRTDYLRVIKPPTNLEPEAAVAYLRAEKAALGDLKLYNPWDWGGYLDLELYPDYRVYMDGRYIFHDLLKEVNETEGSPTRLTKLLDRRGVELALLMNTGRIVSFRGQSAWRPFDVYALPPKDWALVYFDRQSLILVRRSAVSADWLASREFRHIRPHDLRHLGLRVLSGWLPLAEVEKEVDRYQRDIGDPFESRVLAKWLADFKRGLEQADALKAPQARTRPRPGSNRPAAKSP